MCPLLQNWRWRVHLRVSWKMMWNRNRCFVFCNDSCFYIRTFLHRGNTLQRSEAMPYILRFSSRLTQDSLWDFNYPVHTLNAQHCHCEFATLFLFSCSFVSFKPPVTPQKGGKQKRLFTPLLGWRDLEGGSVLSTVVLLNGPWFTPFRSQLVQVCIFVCICNRREGSERWAFQWGQSSPLIVLLCLSPVSSPQLQTPTQSSQLAVIPLLCMGNL